MSAIWGMARLDGAPVSLDDLSAMSAAIRDWGPDGCVIKSCGSAAFGHARLDVLPEDPHTAMPLIHAADRLFVATGRLDNRDDLCDALGIPESERSRTPDTDIIAAAHKRWGDTCAPRLRGDWSFASWDDRERRLVLARDHIGSGSLFYWHHFPIVAFASSVDALLRAPGFDTKLDEEQLARYLIGRHGAANRTFYKDLRFVPLASTVRFDTHAHAPQPYWSIEGAPAIRFPRDADYIEAFLEQFRRAVRTRLRSTRPIASTLSSGLDSGSVTALAAEALGESGRDLIGITGVPRYDVASSFPGNRTDEGPMARAVANRWPNIQHIATRAETRSPVAALEELLHFYSQPVGTSSNVYWLLDLLQTAKDRGAGVLLTGQLGNSGISWSGGPHRIFYLLRSHPLAEGIPALLDWKAWHGATWWQAARRVLVPSFMNTLYRQRHRLRRPSQSRSRYRGAIAPHFLAQLLRDGGFERAEDANADQFVPSERIRPVWLRLGGTAVGTAILAFGSRFRLDVRDPTADVRLLEFCFGIPDGQHVLKGQERSLVRRAMAGLMPDAVLDTRTRGLQSADLALRLADDAAAVEEVLARLADLPAVPKYVDVRELSDLWGALRAGPRRSAPHVGYKLLRGIHAGLFVERTAALIRPY